MLSNQRAGAPPPPPGPANPQQPAPYYGGYYYYQPAQPADHNVVVPFLTHVIVAGGVIMCCGFGAICGLAALIYASKSTSFQFPRLRAGVRIQRHPPSVCLYN